VVNRRGIALLDVIIATVILALGLGVIVSIASRSLQEQRVGERQLAASWLADELLNMVLVEGPLEYPRRHQSQGWFDPPFDQYRYEVAISRDRDIDPYDIVAMVAWVAPNGERSIEIATKIAQRQYWDDEDWEIAEPRAPMEPIDRLRRYFPEDFE
jgi:hypothetical protein